MRKGVRNEPDIGPAAEGVVVTYSRLPRGERDPAERREPFLEAREVPSRDDDLRAFDPDRAARDDFADMADDLDEPPRRRGRVARGAVLIGAVALAAGMVILAYAYGIATRVDTSSTSGAAATAPAGGTRGTLSGNDAARSVPLTGQPPASAAVPMPAPTPADTKTTSPPVQSASTPAPSGSAGTPMDGDAGQPSGHAQPALVAPVPTNTTPAAAAKPADAKSAKAKPVDSNDALMTEIERLLKRDAATANASAQPGSGPAASNGAAPLIPAAQPAGSTTPPQLPDPNATAATTPPANVGPQPGNRLIPPADIPNVAPATTGTGGQ